jgi:uncharacterized protein (TIGR01777 family)
MITAMEVVLTGATGFIGRRLIPRLAAGGHSLRILGRALRKGLPASASFAIWDAAESAPPVDSLAGASAIVHLAGETVAQRWTPDVKRRLRTSRVDGARRLVESLARASPRPAALIGASAIGYYGDRGDETLTEESPAGGGFLAEICRDVEAALGEAASLGVRVATLRIGVVLGPEGGALARMLPPFRLGLGGRLGSGRQWMSWIHVEDLAGLVCHALEGDLRGAVNATAPNPVRNSEFTSALARALRRPGLFPVPEFALKLLFGEMSEVLLGSQRVLPRAAEASGFRFQFPEVFSALKDLLK